MKTFLWMVASTIGVCSLARAEETENPFLKAKVGDWVQYKMVTKKTALDFDATSKMIVTAKTDKEVTVKTTKTASGKEAESHETKIDLTKPYDPLMSARMSAAKVEKLGDGNETIKVKGKEYDCNWMKYRLTSRGNDKEAVIELKVWVSKEVPLWGTVKMEMKPPTGTVTMELTGSGHKR